MGGLAKDFVIVHGEVSELRTDVGALKGARPPPPRPQILPRPLSCAAEERERERGFSVG